MIKKINLDKGDFRKSIVVFLSCLIISFPYFLYNPKHALMAIVVLIIIALLSRFLFVLVGFYSILINAFFLHIVPNWGSHSLDSRVQAAFESPKYEQWEYFKTYFTVFDIAMIVLYIVLAVSVVFLVIRNLDISKNVKRLVLGVSISLVGLSLIIYPTQETIKSFQLIHLPYTIFSTYDRLKVINKRKEYLATQASIDRVCSNPFDKVVFVQGESVNKNHMSLYGYNRKTTPFLDQAELYEFDAIAASNQTRFSIPIELTNATVDNFQKYYESKSLVTTLAECGYTTYWISNQGQKGEFDTTITSIANEAEHSYFINNLDYTTAGLDQSILTTLESIELKGSRKQAFFIHLLGSHVAYSDRYPEQKATFKGNDITSQYDNSVFYTDYILSQIYEKFSYDSLLFVYLADHGEVVDESEYGHGYIPSYKEEYEVPFVILSEAKSRVSDLHKETLGKVINTESIANIMEYILGVRDDSGVSYSTDVISVIPDRRVNYSSLKYYKQ